MAKEFRDDRDMANRRRHFLDDRSLSEETRPNYLNSEGKPIQFNCNEDGIHLFGPEIKYCRGVAIGVGLDQMFDLIILSQISEAYLIDFLPEVTFTRRALLELLVDLFERTGEAPSFEDVIQEISRMENHAFINILRRLGYSAKELDFVNDLKAHVSFGYAGESISLADYLISRSRLAEPNTFFAHSRESLRRLIDMYADGKIHMITADLSGQKTMKQISERIRAIGESVSLIYLSNAETYIDEAGTRSQFVQNMRTLPTRPDSLILRSDDLGAFYRNPRKTDIPVKFTALFGLWHYTVESWNHWGRNNFDRPAQIEYMYSVNNPVLILK